MTVIVDVVPQNTETAVFAVTLLHSRLENLVLIARLFIVHWHGRDGSPPIFYPELHARLCFVLFEGLHSNQRTDDKNYPKG